MQLEPMLAISMAQWMVSISVNDLRDLRDRNEVLEL